MASEQGAQINIAKRIEDFQKAIDQNKLSTIHSFEELEFGARVAWRNSVRCVGRMFWPSLKVFDARQLETHDQIFEAIISHIDWASNDGDIRSAITVFRPGDPEIRILNSQLILYAGYKEIDGKIIGDPKNIPLTKLALNLGWKSKKTEFDILPIILVRGAQRPEYFEIPKHKIIEVKIRHPEYPKIEKLGLKWFALPAVSNMALDMGGIAYPAAPTSGVYQGTEIGSFNLSDPKRYNKLLQIADAMDLDVSKDNPLWKDQAMLEINRAVVFSFNCDGVKIFDHHSLADSFEKFYKREELNNRTVYGHWPWITPPLSSNLSWVWHEKKFKKDMVKPGYFYQALPKRIETLLKSATI